MVVLPVPVAVVAVVPQESSCVSITLMIVVGGLDEIVVVCEEDSMEYLQYFQLSWFPMVTPNVIYTNLRR